MQHVNAHFIRQWGLFLVRQFNTKLAKIEFLCSGLLLPCSRVKTVSLEDATENLLLAKFSKRFLFSRLAYSHGEYLLWLLGCITPHGLHLSAIGLPSYQTVVRLVFVLQKHIWLLHAFDDNGCKVCVSDTLMFSASHSLHVQPVSAVSRGG